MNNVKKMKIILTMVTLSLIIGISGCSGNLSTAPWSEDEVNKMADDKIDTVPIARYRF
jgi:hypothetical protein